MSATMLYILHQDEHCSETVFNIGSVILLLNRLEAGGWHYKVQRSQSIRCHLHEVKGSHEKDTIIRANKSLARTYRTFDWKYVQASPKP